MAAKTGHHGGGVHRLRAVAKARARTGVERRQEQLELEAVTSWANERSVALEVFTTWSALVSAAAFWSSMPISDFAGLAFRAILKRCEELEVSTEGIGLLRSLAVAPQSGEGLC